MLSNGTILMYVRLMRDVSGGEQDLGYNLIHTYLGVSLIELKGTDI